MNAITKQKIIGIKVIPAHKAFPLSGNSFSAIILKYRYKARNTKPATVDNKNPVFSSLFSIQMQLANADK